MKYRITSDEKQNRESLPINPNGLNCLDFSYYTLCRIASQTMFTFPTAKTMALYAQENGAQELTLDDLGNFVSLKPI